MKFSPKCKAERLGMIYTILGIFRSFFNWEGTDIQPQIFGVGKSLTSHMQ